MDLDKVFDVMEKNERLFNRYYSGSLDLEANRQDELNVYIMTKDKRDNIKKRAKIKKLLKAKEVMYISEYEPECKKCGNYHPPFWAITW